MSNEIERLNKKIQAIADLPQSSVDAKVKFKKMAGVYLHLFESFIETVQMESMGGYDISLIDSEQLSNAITNLKFAINGANFNFNSNSRQKIEAEIDYEFGL